MERDAPGSGRLSVLGNLHRRAPGLPPAVGRFWPAGALVALQLAVFPVPSGVWLQGLLVGSLTALIAIGMALIYRSNRIINFAQGDLGSAPTVLVILLMTASGWPWGAAVAAGLGAAVALGALVELVVIRRFRRAPRLLLTVATLGLSQVLTGLAIAMPQLWDERLLAPRIGAPFDARIEVGGVVFRGNDILAMSVAPVVVVLLATFLRRTAAGVAVRASADSDERAGLLGIPVQRLQTIVWTVAAVLAFTATFLRAGVLGLPLGPALSYGVLLRALAALMLGRLTDLPAVGAAAVALGVLELGVAWNATSPLLIDPVLAVVVVAGLLVQGRAMGGARRLDVSSWRLADEARPVPAALRRLPEVRAVRWAGAALIAITALTLPHVVAIDTSLLTSAALIYAVLGLSLVVLTGWAGHISLGQVAFFALGAAIAAKVVGGWGHDLSLAVLAAAAAGAAAAVVVGLPALRLRGVYLAVTTFAFALATTSYLLNRRFFDWVPTGRVERRPLFGAIDLASPTRLYYLVLVVLAIVLLALRGIRRSRAGRALIALRENEPAAQSFGVRPVTAKLGAFAVSGAVAAVAGALFAYHQQAFGSAPFAPSQNFAVFTMVVVGGVGAPAGALLGAGYLRGVDHLLPGAWQLLASGAGVLVVLLLLPSGLGGAALRLRDRWLRRVAQRRGIVVPELLADVRAVGADADTEPAPPTGQDGGRRRERDDVAPLPAADDGPALLTARDLTVAYDGVQVLFGVDLDVRRGEIVALLGTNGAGKSTLLKAISGVVEADHGSVLLDGRDITNRPPHAIAAAGVTLMPGGAGVFPSLTVGENLQAASWLERHDRAEVQARVDQVLDELPVLRQRWAHAADDLSGGQQQMLALGMTLLARPRLLMIDELTLGLAPAVVEQLLPVVRQVAESGTGVVLVEQSVNLALTLATRAYFMEKGEVRFHGATAELLERPDVLRSVFLEGAAAVGGAAPGDASRHEVDRAARRPAGSVAPATPAEPVLETRGLSRSFGGIRAVHEVDLSVRPAEIVGVIGPNGAGKTTLFDLIGGTTPPDVGVVRLNGSDVTGFGPAALARRGLGRSFQDGRLFPAMTVEETIAVAMERWVAAGDLVSAALRLPPVFDAEEAVAARVTELVELFGLGAYRYKLVRELSTGSRRVVDLACLVAHRPTVILLDEPSSGIAQREAEALGPLLLRMREEMRASLVIIEHDIALISGIADRMVAMDQGSVIAAGEPAAVCHDPAVVASYLGTDRAAIARSGPRT